MGFAAWVLLRGFGMRLRMSVYFQKALQRSRVHLQLPLGMAAKTRKSKHLRSYS
jgi:hypothetical protein